MSSNDGWGVSAEQQEKNISSLSNLALSNNIHEPIPPPVCPAGKSANSKSYNEDDEPEINAAEMSLMKKLTRQRLLPVKADLEIQQKNPKSPLYSVKSFEELNLNPDLLRGVYDMGFNAPSKIQETALPTLLADPPQNMIAQSQSGTGKTAAFILSALSRVNTNVKHPQVLVLSPTYELALQTGEVAKRMAKFCPNIEFCFAVRGETLERGTHIQAQFLIGTPGKVFDWAKKFRFFDPNEIRVFILDEADVMIDTQGYQDQSVRIHKLLPKTCQMMLFSATYTDEVIKFAELIVSDPIIIKLKREEESLDNIKQYYIQCRNPEEKLEAVSNIYGTISIGQAIIFCHTKKTASWLAEKMTKEGHNVGLLSGELTVEQRIAVLNRFRDGKEKVLITTNVCARGIDIEQVTVVINFDLPINQAYEADCETYLHRIGRTGRFGKMGQAINMVDGPKSMAMLKQIQEHFGKQIIKIDATDLDDLEQMASR